MHTGLSIHARMLLVSAAFGTTETKVDMQEGVPRSSSRSGIAPTTAECGPFRLWSPYQRTISSRIPLAIQSDLEQETNSLGRDRSTLLCIQPFTAPSRRMKALRRGGPE